MLDKQGYMRACTSPGPHARTHTHTHTNVILIAFRRQRFANAPQCHVTALCEIQGNDVKWTLSEIYLH